VSPSAKVEMAAVSSRWECVASTMKSDASSPGPGPEAHQELLRSFMREAIVEGRKALPACRPNPPVGCVLVRNDAIIARGYTQPPYQPHAEPFALAQVEGDLTDVTAFVTLEPCAFHQRTPSCAKEMIARRIGYVYVALLDPHPRNQGRGIQMLRDAGISVVTDFLQAEAAPELSPYLHGAQGSEPPMGW
jgi:pyrimidine deaminase RibD-like protein